MADNIASEFAKFLKSEGRNQLRGITSNIISGAVSGGRDRNQQSQVRRRTNLAGTALMPGGIATTMSIRKLSGTAQNVATTAGGMVAKGATDESGATLQGSIEMAKNQVNAFTNLFTAPGIKSIGDFFGVMADAPKNILSFGEALLSVTGKLKDVSPAFAAISAEQEIRQLERDIRTGEQTGGSATALSEAMEGFKDAMLPVQNDIYNTTAELVTDLVPIAKQMFAIMGPFFKATTTLLAEVVKAISKVAIPVMIAILEAIVKLVNLIKLTFMVIGQGRFMGYFKDAAAAMQPIVTTLYKMLDGIRDLNKAEDEDEKMNAHQIAIAALRMRMNETVNPKEDKP